MRELRCLQRNQLGHGSFVEKMQSKFAQTRELLRDKRTRSDFFRFISKKESLVRAKGGQETDGEKPEYWQN